MALKLVGVQEFRNRSRKAPKSFVEYQFDDKEKCLTATLWDKRLDGTLVAIKTFSKPASSYEEAEVLAIRAGVQIATGRR